MRVQPINRWWLSDLWVGGQRRSFSGGGLAWVGPSGAVLGGEGGGNRGL